MGLPQRLDWHRGQVLVISVAATRFDVNRPPLATVLLGGSYEQKIRRSLFRLRSSSHVGHNRVFAISIRRPDYHRRASDAESGQHTGVKADHCANRRRNGLAFRER